jgi:hypothetical protein
MASTADTIVNHAYTRSRPMSEVPSRSDSTDSESDAELARLAADGRSRISEAGAAQRLARERDAEEKSDENVRDALGARYGSGVRKTIVALFGACAVMCVLSLATCAAADKSSSHGGSQGLSIVSAVLGGLSGLSLLGALSLLLSRRSATRAQVAAERAWAASLPFAMDGYFDLLGRSGNVACHLVIELVWQPGRAPDLGTVQGVLGVLDTDARTQSSEHGSISVRSTALACAWTNSRNVKQGSNRQVVEYTHRLIEKVLLPLHRSHPLARISLTRDDELTEDEISAARLLGFTLRKW